MNDRLKRAMKQKIVIRHLSGSKINQTNEFQIADFEKLSFGRDEDSDIRYDPEKDDLVSRKQAVIHREDGNNFSIRDQESRNGTLVNKQRVSGTTSLHHGDIVQFGSGGPEFLFELDPPPRFNLPQTREASLNHFIQPTREVSTADLPQVSGVSKRQDRYDQKSRYTLLQDSFSLYKQKTLRTQISIGAALLGLIILIAGLSYALIIRSERKTDDLLADVSETHQSEMAGLEKKVNEIAKEKTSLMSPQAIGEKFSKAVVKIQLSWKLTHSETNQQVYHQVWNKVPAYLDINGKIIPWLTTDPENNTNRPINGTSHGTGFLASRNGLILTHLNVAAGATKIWNIQPYMLQKSLALVFPVTEDRVRENKMVYKVDRARPEMLSGERFQQLLKNTSRWVPHRETILVKKMDGGKFIVTDSKGQFFSRDTLHIHFQGDPNPVPGQLAIKSIQHDVALITVDSHDTLSETILEKKANEPLFGEPVTILGYTEVSEDILGWKTIAEPFNKEPVFVRIYHPTVTTGNMGTRINFRIEYPDSATEHLFAGKDYYQLTVNSTESGFTGGPVFNSRGRVSGILSGDLEGGLSKMPLAIPIEYGRKLLNAYALSHESNIGNHPLTDHQ